MKECSCVRLCFVFWGVAFLPPRKESASTYSAFGRGALDRFGLARPWVRCVVPGRTAADAPWFVDVRPRRAHVLPNFPLQPHPTCIRAYSLRRGCRMTQLFFELVLML